MISLTSTIIYGFRSLVEVVIIYPGDSYSLTPLPHAAHAAQRRSSQGDAFQDLGRQHDQKGHLAHDQNCSHHLI